MRARGAAIAAIATTAVACGGQSTQAVGFSAPRAVERSVRASDGGAVPEASPVPETFRSTFTKVGERFLSEGHGRRYQAVLWLNDVARVAWAALPGEMPDGALVVEEAIDQDRSGERPAGLWVMEKKGAAWRFVAVGPGGEVASGARTAPCADCHGEAPRDDLFVEITRAGR
jgi:hypothetical protein